MKLQQKQSHQEEGEMKERKIEIAKHILHLPQISSCRSLWTPEEEVSSFKHKEFLPMTTTSSDSSSTDISADEILQVVESLGNLERLTLRGDSGSHFSMRAIHFPTTLQKIDFRFDKEVDPLPLVGDVQFEFVRELHVSNCRFSELISHFPKLEQFHVSRFEGDITQEEIDSIFDLFHLKTASIQTCDICEHGPTINLTKLRTWKISNNIEGTWNQIEIGFN